MLFRFEAKCEIGVKFRTMKIFVIVHLSLSRQNHQHLPVVFSSISISISCRCFSLFHPIQLYLQLPAGNVTFPRTPHSQKSATLPIRFRFQISYPFLLSLHTHSAHSSMAEMCLQWLRKSTMCVGVCVQLIFISSSFINGFEGVFKYLIFENLTLLACQLFLFFPLPSFHRCTIEKGA